MATNDTGQDFSRILIGFTYSTLSLVELFFYVPCLIVIRKDPELKDNSCFKLMFNLGICDILNIVGQTYGGIITMAGLGLVVPGWVNQLLGWIMLTSWGTYLALLHLIAMNRFVEICLSARAKYLLFDEKRVRMWVAILWLYGFTRAAVAESPVATFVYIPNLYTWYFTPDSAAWFMQLFWLVDLVVVSSAMVYYVMVVFYLRFKVAVTGTEAQNNMRNKERQVLRQAAVFGVFTFVVTMYWNSIPILYSLGFQYGYIFGNILWVSNSGVNPLVYLTMNQTISGKVREMFRLTNGTVAPATTQNQQGRGTATAGTRANPRV